MKDIDLIPSGQSLYYLNFVDGGTSLVWKVPADDFASFAGDVLITQESPPVLNIFHWDGAHFLLRQIELIVTPGFGLEHVTFAPF